MCQDAEAVEIKPEAEVEAEAEVKPETEVVEEAAEPEVSDYISAIKISIYLSILYI